jgi:hypothetical protein
LHREFAGVDIGFGDRSQNILWDVCNMGHLRVAEWLLSLGLKGLVDNFNSDGEIIHGAFFHACELGNVKVAQWLYPLVHPGTESIVGHALLHGGETEEHGSKFVSRISCLEAALRNNHVDMADWLVSTSGEHLLGTAGDGLAFACLFHHVSVVQWLLLKYAHKNYSKLNDMRHNRKYSGLNAIELAFFDKEDQLQLSEDGRADFRIFDLIVSNGADIFKPRLNGESLLHWLIRKSRPFSVLWIIGQGGGHLAGGEINKDEFIKAGLYFSLKLISAINLHMKPFYLFLSAVTRHGNLTYAESYSGSAGPPKRQSVRNDLVQSSAPGLLHGCQYVLSLVLDFLCGLRGIRERRVKEVRLFLEEEIVRPHLASQKATS